MSIIVDNNTPIFTGLSSISTSNVIFSGGNVGIDTAAPTVKLDIIGTTSGSLRMADNAIDATNKVGRIVGRPYTNADTNFLAFDIRGLTTSNEINYGGGSGILNSATSHTFYTAANKTTLTGTSRMIIDSSGKVGIGTTSPSSTLSVGGNPPAAGAIGAVGASGGISLALSDNVNSSLYVKHAAAGVATLGTDAGGSLAFAINGYTEAIRINSSGLVGIGTTGPSYKLDVTSTDTIGIRYIKTATRDARIQLGDPTKTWSFASGWATAGDFSIIEEGVQGNSLYIKQGGNVGISTSSPTQKLEVSGTGYATSDFRAPIFYDSANTAYYLDPANTGTSLNVAGTSIIAGNVAIGYASTTRKLDVNGITKTLGFLNTADCFEKIFPSVSSFTNATANLAVDVRLGNLSFWGYIEVEVTSTYNYQNATGKLTKIFAVGTGVSNLIYTNESRISDAMGTVPDNFAIGDFAWDAVNTTYKIPISHIVSSGNTISIRVKMFTNGGGSEAVMDAITVSPVYTLTALARQWVYYNNNIGIGKVTPLTRLDVLGEFRVSNATGVGGDYDNYCVRINAYYSGDALKIYGNSNYEYFGVYNYTKTALGLSGDVGIGTSTPGQKLQVAGTAYATGDFRAPIFYDSNDTTYYADPNGTSVLTTIYARKTAANNTPAIQVRGGSPGYPRIQVYGLDADGNAWMGFGADMGGGSYEHSIYFPTTGPGRLTIGDYNGTTFNTRFTVFQANYVQATGSFRAPIFYDSDNTGYYGDFASTSNFNRLNLVGFDSSGRNYSREWIEFPNLSGLYSPTNGAHFYPNGASSYGSWNLQGTRSGWAGIYFSSGGNTAHYMLESGNGGLYFESGGRWANYYSYGNNCTGFGTSTTSSAYNIYCPTGVYSGGRVDGTIFYDTNDTGYYGDFNSSGVSLRIGGAIQSNHVAWTGEMNKIQWHSGNMYFQNMSDAIWRFRNSNGVEPISLYAAGYGEATASWRAPLFYDSNDTTYYGDFNSLTSWQGLTLRGKAQTGLTGKSQWKRPDITGDSNYWVGSMGWGTEDLNTVMTWGSGFFDTWSNPANQPSGTSHWVGVQASHYSNAYNSMYGWQMCGGPIGNLRFRQSWPGSGAWRTLPVLDVNEGNGGSMYAGIYYDANNTGYYVDGDGTSKFNNVQINYVTQDINFQAKNIYDVNSIATTVLYDHNNTYYYLDPSSGSRLSTLRCEGNAITIQGSSPTITYQDTDGYSAFHHCNSDVLYILRGCAVNADNGNWCISGSAGNWPMQTFLNGTFGVLFGTEVKSTGAFVSYYSDDRLKTRQGYITNAIDKIKTLSTFYFVNNDLAKSFGFTKENQQVGCSAQEIEAIMPQVVSIAPFDMKGGNPNLKPGERNEDPEGSKSGENYKTVDYSRLVPLLIAAIKEQQVQIDELRALINN